MKTVVYVHGIANKPPEDVLKCQWDRALFGHSMGDRTRMAYWVNRTRYPVPSPGECGDPDAIRPAPVNGYSGRGISIAGFDDERLPEDMEVSARGKAFIGKVRKALAERRRRIFGDPGSGTSGDLSITDLSTSLGESLRLISWLTEKYFLPDVHDFFYDKQRRAVMEQALIARLQTGGGPFVVIGHSQGTMIAYKVLSELKGSAKVEVPLFVTIGSPLGLAPVRAEFKRWHKRGKLAVPACVGHWINVANKWDIVSADTNLTDDIIDRSRGKFENHVVDSPNDELRADRHSGTGYLRTKPVQDAVLRVLGRDFAQHVGRQLISHDLVDLYEKASDRQRVPTLVEIKLEDDRDAANIDECVSRIKACILEAAITDGMSKSQERETEERLQFFQHKRYVSARLTRDEIERLRTSAVAVGIHRLWKDSERRALIDTSGNTLQVTPANRAYQARGRGITWAVLDSGIDVGHEHFQQHSNIKELWDCTRASAPPTLMSGVDPVKNDLNGHGTHVAGIIAGEFAAEGRRLAGMAPLTALRCFKVLDDRGVGSDSNIIKALDKIADVNERSVDLVIHGVNLSLGGDFDPQAYACGHSPLCNELRRLWRQGVLVVLAAGNEGFDVLRTASGEARQTNIDLSIGDPANLEEAIAVGSVHSKRPHMYGISYFSSRGPTADGRRKPDVVAPGEKILSARAGGRGNSVQDFYVEFDGTSMAAPHVSGVLSAFLSIRREFIGYPDKVKELLLTHATDLRRDHYLQGTGMPNLVRMLAAT